MAITDLNFSARAYDRLLKVARTIADLAGAETIAVPHIGEAIQAWPRSTRRCVRGTSSKINSCAPKAHRHRSLAATPQDGSPNDAHPEGVPHLDRTSRSASILPGTNPRIR
jgi:hypothetical protein